MADELVALCTPCEMVAYGEPPLDTFEAILKAAREDMIQVTCAQCGNTDIRVRGLTRPVLPES